MMRLFRVSACFFLVLCFLSSAESGEIPIDANARLESIIESSCAGWKAHGGAVTVRLENEDISGAILEVPRAYIMSPGFHEASVRSTLILSVWKQNFAPYTYDDTRREAQRDKVRNGRSDQMTILIDPALPLDTIARRSVTGGYGLPYDSPKADLEGIRLGNGLFGQRIAPLPRRSEVFFGKSDGRITDIIRCRRWGDVPSPQLYSLVRGRCV